MKRPQMRELATLSGVKNVTCELGRGEHSRWAFTCSAIDENNRVINALPPEIDHVLGNIPPIHFHDNLIRFEADKPTSIEVKDEEIQIAEPYSEPFTEIERRLIFK